MIKYNEEDMKVLKRAYIDYKQLERQLNIDIGDTEDIRKVYDYIDDLRGASFTNVSLEVGEYFDFNYKDMCLTISKNNYRNVCKLAESVELWNDKEETYVGTLDFDDLEKIVLGYDEQELKIMESKLLKKVENAILNDEYGITKIN